MFISNSNDDRDRLKAAYRDVRGQTMLLAAPLSPEDQTVQTMPNVSPTKWHLAHTSWFFETFMLKPFLPSYEEKFASFDYLFNSYYEQIGPKWPRPQRGLLSRPSVSEIQDYRLYIDQSMARLIEEASSKDWEEISSLLLLGFQP